jgi:hypothetical protein
MSLVLIGVQGNGTTAAAAAAPLNEPILNESMMLPAAWAADYRSQPPGVSGAAMARLIAGVAGNNKILRDHGRSVS